MDLRKLQNELTNAEKKWREVNEKELPEEELQNIVKQTRRVLNDLQ